MAVAIAKKTTEKVEAVTKEVMEKVSYLFSKADELSELIGNMTAERYGRYLEIAELTCPYEVGQIVVTKEGLGRHGLKIHAIVPAVTPEADNLWGIETYALSKAGEVTRRGVFLDHKTNDIVGVKNA